MTTKTARLDFYGENFEIFKRGVKSELRLYSRDNTKAHSCVAFSAAEKKIIKPLGFKWDKRNHSYYLENPTAEAIAAIEPIFSITTYDRRKRQ
jgi:hypothetical protein